MSKLEELKQFTNKVKRAAAGNWDRILWTLVPEIQPALEYKGRRHITCPFHGGKNDFRVSKDVEQEGRVHCTCFPNQSMDGWGLVMKRNRWDFPKAVEEVDAVLGGRGYQPTRPFKMPERVEKARKEPTDEELMARMQKWWGDAMDLDDPAAAPVRKYFKARKIGEVLLPLPDVRLHPDLGYYEAQDDGEFKKVGSYPCLLSVIRSPNGRVSTLHRAWITPDGTKVAHDSARKQYTSPNSAPVTGGAIRLDDWDGNPVLHVAEGLETALSARAITRQPTWSTVNAGMMARLEVPSSVRIVVIWADLDRSKAGEEAADELAKRLAARGIASMVFLPPVALPEGAKTVDWNDVVAGIGLDAARNHFQVLRVKRWVSEQLGRINVRPENVAIA